MYKFVKKDRKERISYKKNEFFLKIMKAVAFDGRLSGRYRIFFFYTFFFSGVQRTRMKNVCLYSSRVRGIVRFFKCSRIVFRRFVLSGYFTGVRKASW